MKRRLFTAALLLLVMGGTSSGFAQGDSAWTLEQCIEQALRSSPRLQVGRAALRGAEAAASEASAMRWPTATLSGAYNYTSEAMEFQVPGLPIPGYTPPTIAFGDGNVYDAALTVRYPLYGGGAVIAKSRAEAAGLNAARSDLGTEHLKLLYDVRRAYYNALGAEAKAGAARQSVQRLQRHLDDITGIQAAGAAMEENRILAEARLRQAESVMLAVEADLSAAQFALGGLLTEPGTAIVPRGILDQPLFDEHAAPPEAASRPDVAALEFRIDRGQHLSRAARGALRPALSAAVALHYAKPGINLPQNEWMDYYTAGVTASWTLWDFRARSHRTRQAQAATQLWEARRAELVTAIETRRSAAFVALDAARAVRGKASDRLTLEQRRLALVEGRRQAGMASDRDFLDALDDVTAAQTDYAAALIRVRLAETELLHALGY